MECQYTGEVIDSGELALAGGRFNIEADSARFNFSDNGWRWNSGTISGVGVLTNEGELTVETSNNKSFRDLTLENTGTLNWSQGTINGFNGATIDNSGTVDITGNIFFDNDTFNDGDRPAFNNTGMFTRSQGLGEATFESTFTNSGTVSVETGRLQLDAGYTQTAGLTEVAAVATLGGKVDILGGTLQGSGLVNGNVTMNGTLSPGNSVGEIRIRGGYTQSSSVILSLELENVNDFDQVFVNGTVTLGGQLDITVLDGFTPTLGDTYTVLSANNIEGEFNRIQGLDLGNGRLLQPVIEENELRLSVKSSRLSRFEDLAFGETGVDVINETQLRNGEENGVILFLGGDIDRAWGGLGDDILDASQGSGNNRLYGGQGEDQLFAGSEDILFGGSEADEFWVVNNTLPEGENIVGDFTLGTDIIGLAGVNLSFDQLNISDRQGDAVISSNNQPLALIKNTAAGNLSEDHFIFTENN